MFIWKSVKFSLELVNKITGEKKKLGHNLQKRETQRQRAFPADRKKLRRTFKTTI